MVSRRRLITGTAAVVGTLGLGAAGATAWASTRRAAVVGGGMPLPDGTVVPVEYRTRADWGCYEGWMRWPAGPEEWGLYGPVNDYQKLKYVRRPVQAITVHYQGEDPGNLMSDPAAVVRSIYNYQSNGEHWDDIGYNLLIDPYGIVYEGRHNVAEGWPIFGPASDPSLLMTTGAHVGGYNSGNIGICLLGDFSHSGGVPTSAAWTALRSVLVALGRLCHLDPRAVVNYYNPVPAATTWDTNTQQVPEVHATRTVLAVSGHQDWASTSCPGPSFYPLLPQLRAEVAALLVPPVPHTRPAPSASQPPPSPEVGERPPITGEPPSPGPVGRTRRP